MHLFDIDIPGKIAFKESEILSAGSEFSTFSMGKLKFGLGICYDLRFPEFATVLGEMGCHVMVLPSAFNTTTGPLHWHLLARGRAVDTQSFVILASPARNVDASYPVYGHSLIISPM
jgi:predicted amidohydrolase